MKALNDFFRPVFPAERLAAIRVGVGFFALVYLVLRSPGIIQATRQAAELFQPVGPVKLLTSPAAPAVTIAVHALSIVLALLFLVGYRFRLVAPLFAASILWTLSYRNSFGMVFHTENLMVLQVCLLSFTDAAAAYSLDARRQPTAAPARRFGFGVRALAIATVFAYVLAGVAKLRVTGISWAGGEILRNHVAHDNLRKLLLGDSYSPIGIWLAHHSWLFPPLAVFALVLELGAPLALLSERLGRYWAVAMWSFHFGVLLVMWIFFPFPLFGFAFAPFFPVERLAQRWTTRGKQSGLEQSEENLLPKEESTP
jgi:uncharacterized membrane protein YphA (DoxX/SURF4 family)